MAGSIVAAASSDGTVYGFERHSGAIVWTVPPVGSHDPAGDGAPRVEDVRALAYASGTLVATSLTGTLVAVDPRNGRERWRSVSPLDGSIAFAAVTDERAAYLPHVAGWLVKVDLADGVAQWRVGGSSVRFEHPPAVFEHRVYATSEEGLYGRQRRARSARRWRLAIALLGAMAMAAVMSSPHRRLPTAAGSWPLLQDRASGSGTLRMTLWRPVSLGHLVRDHRRASPTGLASVTPPVGSGEPSTLTCGSGPARGVWRSSPRSTV
jgi:hypothetical protein